MSELSRPKSVSKLLMSQLSINGKVGELSPVDDHKKGQYSLSEALKFSYLVNFKNTVTSHLRTTGCVTR